MNLGLLGVENSHAKNFCRAFNELKRHDGFRITSLYGGDDLKTAASLSDEFGITQYETEEEVIERTDALVATYRSGSAHHASAMKALKAGKPLFLDKPFTTCPDETAEILAYAKEKGILLAGGSSFKGAPGFAAPMAVIKPGSHVIVNYAADPASEYDGYWFYGIHSVEICIKLCGENFTSVTAYKNNSLVVSNVHYPDKHCVIITTPDSRNLGVTVTNGNETTHFPISTDFPDYLYICADEFANMLKTKKIPYSFSHYQRATDLMAEIARAIEK